MKWIVSAIILFMIVYTALTLHFRKPNPSYEPYHDMKARGENRKLLTAGYQRITVPADQPTGAVEITSPATIRPAPAGAPALLIESLFEPPVLPESYRHVETPAQLSAFLPCVLLIDCTVANLHQQFSVAQLYLRDQSIVIIPEFEKLEGSLLSRGREHHIRMTIPGGTLKPGRYEIILPGTVSSQTWTLQVN